MKYSGSFPEFPLENLLWGLDFLITSAKYLTKSNLKMVYFQILSPIVGKSEAEG